MSSKLSFTGSLYEVGAADITNVSQIHANFQAQNPGLLLLGDATANETRGNAKNTVSTEGRIVHLAH